MTEADSNRPCRWEQEWTRANVRVVDCKTCGFRHQFPIPAPEAVESLYREEYYATLKPEYQRIIEEDADHFRMWANSKRTVCEQFLPACGAGARSILDVGSSFGQTLVAYRDAGWRAVGVEPAVTVAQYARERTGLDIHTGLLENISDHALGPPFDIVHLAEVINHMRDPAGTLSRIGTRLLKPGGMVAVETSNDFNDLQEAIVDVYDDERWWIVPDHVAYFNRATLTGLLERLGFTVRRVESTFPMELFPLLGDNFRRDPALGKACHRKRVTFEMKLERIGQGATRRRLYTALAEAGFGRSIIVYAQRDAEPRMPPASLLQRRNVAK